MKTAMQELIEDLQKHFENQWGHLLKEEAFKPFLEKEKEQIIQAVDDNGFYNASGIVYYEEKYQNK